MQILYKLNEALCPQFCQIIGCFHQNQSRIKYARDIFLGVLKRVQMSEGKIEMLILIARIRNQLVS